MTDILLPGQKAIETKKIRDENAAARYNINSENQKFFFEFPIPDYLLFK
jgi:hypothetical protein